MSNTKETLKTDSHALLSGVSEIELRNKIIDVLSDISRMDSKGEWHAFMNDQKNAAMITKLWNYCR